MSGRHFVRYTLLATAILWTPVLLAQTRPQRPQAPVASSGNAAGGGRLRLTDPQPLDPKELLAVQGIGGAVVRSRARAPQADAQIADLYARLQELRGAVDAGLVMRPSALTVIQSASSIAGNPKSASQAEPTTPGTEPTMQPFTAVAGAVSAKLASVHQSRLRLQTRPTGVTDTALLSRRQTLAKRAAELESAVQAALAAPASDRYRLLRDVQGRLVPKSLREEFGQLQSLQPGVTAPASSRVDAGSSLSAASTPTFTTLVRHR